MTKFDKSLVEEASAARRPKALVFFDQDVTIRHFIQGGAFLALEKAYDVGYVFHVDSTSKKSNIHSAIDALPVARKITVDIPRSRGGTWDHLVVASMFRYARKLPNFQPLMRLYQVMYSERLLRALRLVAIPGVFEIFRGLFKLRMSGCPPLMELIEREKPDVLIHPSVLLGFLIDDLVLTSKKTGIPLVCLMNSWDNPSQKRAAAGCPTKLVVWGEQGLQHAVSYFGMPAADVVIGGAAQFEVYRDPGNKSAAELRAEFGAPEGVPIVLYAGCSKGVVESTHLKLIDDAISDGRIPKCHVIYRPHPWKSRMERGERDVRTLGLKHVTIDPYMADYYDRITRETVNGFQLADYNVTVRLFRLVNAIISPLSTMMVEAALCGKPVLCLTTDEDRFDKRLTMRDMRQLVHFAEFFGKPGVHECWDPAQLPQACRRLLEDAANPAVIEDLKVHARFFVDMGDESYGARLLRLVETLRKASAQASGKLAYARA